jgi:hypothetical protein
MANAQDKLPGPLPRRVSEIRLSTPIRKLLDDMGLLADFAGKWTGTGFNLIWRPFFGQGSDHFLEINLTEEDLKFDLISAPIPNRGLAQADITLFGLHYLQQINDATTKGALHLEPGIWINVPATTKPPESQSVARMATIPHGNALLAQGTAVKVNGGITAFDSVNTIPFTIGANTPVPFPTESNLSNASNFRTNPLPTSVPLAKLQAAVNNPNSLLQDAIVGQNISEMVVIKIATAPSITVGGTTPATVVTTPNGAGGVENIPFLVPNADAATVFATFWIETINRGSGQDPFLQLQYSQTVFLNFNGLSWPHVSVATLRKH